MVYLGKQFDTLFSAPCAGQVGIKPAPKGGQRASQTGGPHRQAASMTYSLPILLG